MEQAKEIVYDRSTRRGFARGGCAWGALHGNKHRLDFDEMPQNAAHPCYYVLRALNFA